MSTSTSTISPTITSSSALPSSSSLSISNTLAMFSIGPAGASSHTSAKKVISTYSPTARLATAKRMYSPSKLGLPSVAAYSLTFTRCTGILSTISRFVSNTFPVLVTLIL